jgi:MoxR-like ATPase
VSNADELGRVDASPLGDEDMQAAKRLTEAYQAIRKEMARVIIGQEQVLEELMMCIFARGHAILEGVPGLAKTLMVSSLAQCLDLGFSRIQFTPDLMPSDITGTEVIQEEKSTGQREFKFFEGPIFSHVILADEINRTPPKTQAALLEAMQERQVTIGGKRMPMTDPFFVLATQNPIEQEGTYPLPEAQVDRFMLKVKITYPKPDEERKVMDLAFDGTTRNINPVISPGEVFAMQEVTQLIYIDDQVKNYILSIVQATRDPSQFKMKELEPLIEYGGSPRASIYLGYGARAMAFLQGRGYVTPQDVKDIAYDVLRHRVILTYEAEAEQTTPEDVIQSILATVPVP